jgi:hypothetical protein
LQRHRKLLRDQNQHRFLEPHRLAQVAGEHAADPIEVLNMERLIEAVLSADLFEHSRVTLLASHGERRVTRQQLLQAEDDH